MTLAPKTVLRRYKYRNLWVPYADTLPDVMDCCTLHTGAICYAHETDLNFGFAVSTFPGLISHPDAAVELLLRMVTASNKEYFYLIKEQKFCYLHPWGNVLLPFKDGQRTFTIVSDSTAPHLTKLDYGRVAALASDMFKEI